MEVLKYLLLILFTINLTAQQTDTFTINAVGDIMLGTHYPSKNYLPPDGDCSPLLKSVKKYLKDADLTFGNCEGTFADEPEKYVKPCKSPKYCYRFAMPEKFINCFVEAGFDLLSIANNHIHDLQEYGKKNTIKVIEQAGLHCAGVCIQPEDTFTINGVKIGFCAFAPSKQCKSVLVNWIPFVIL